MFILALVVSPPHVLLLVTFLLRVPGFCSALNEFNNLRPVVSIYFSVVLPTDHAVLTLFLFVLFSVLLVLLFLNMD